MKIFVVTYRNHVGKFDEYHCSYENADHKFKTYCEKLLPGDNLLLLQINLDDKKGVMKLKERTI